MSHYEVRLPRTHVPQFPDRCVVCGQEQPDSTARVSTRSIGWWSWLSWLPGSKFAVEAPACSWCAGKLRRQLWFRWLLTLALIGAATFLIGPVLDQVPIQRHLRTWALAGAVLLALMPYFIWESIFPPPLDLTAYTDVVEYEFRDREYADEFATLNVVAADSPDENEHG